MDFKILLERVTPALKAIARKRVLYGFYDADDLYQQMCLYLWQRFKEGMPIGINESYVIKACEFHILNYLRKGHRAPSIYSLDTQVSDTDLTFKDMLPDSQQDLSSSADNNINMEAIKRNLTQKERRVLDLLIKGDTVREIAVKLGISHVMVVKYKKNIIKKSKI
ncbi:MAG: sigma-70 family RNA polymerase sigma factor [Candidatus Orphnella occulta]|nr:sigma-70 family RNA polymerase sigma factor [Candidatus Orphnella occulta]